MQGLSAVAAFANIATLLIEITGYRKTPVKVCPQLDLPILEAA
jgi:hypothetical protein